MVPRTSKLLCAITVALFATSCITPRCIPSVFGRPSPTKALLVLTVHSEPLEEPRGEPYPNGYMMRQLFERGAAIRLDTDGGMTVSRLDMWPERCLTISRENLAQVVETWQPFLDQLSRARTDIRALADPVLNDDWRPDGPVLSLSFGSGSERLVHFLWDGRSSLPPELETAVVGTLETVCSNSRRAKKYLLRDLPEQVAARLDCQPTLVGGSNR